MRKFVFLIFGLLSVALWAKDVPADKAKEFAARFLRTGNYSRATGAGLQLVYSGESAGSRSGGSAPAYYVFGVTGGKGFVIVAGDDIAMPILGYSFENEFPQGDYPPNLESWLEGIRWQIDEMRKDGVTQTEHVSRAWTSMSPGAAVVKLETALWDQYAPYNGMCPKINGQASLTGCTATALAIAMRYHKWPKCGTGTLKGYTTTTYPTTIADLPLTEPYDWDNMLMAYQNGAYTATEGNAVAQLMRDCGILLKSDFQPVNGGGTGAVINNALPAIIDNMGYDKSVHILPHDSYADTEWHDMLKTNLNSDMPIVYTGYNPSAGHAFVLDGYTDNNYFHVNWGWSGASNGYFLLSAMDPSNQGSGGSNSHYNNNQYAVLNLRPDAGGEYAEEIRFTKAEQGGVVYNGLTPSTTKIEQNVPFTLKAGATTNIGSNKFNGYFLWALTDKEGNIKQELSKAKISGLEPGVGYLYNNSINCTITVPIVGGDRIRMFYQSAKSSEWTVTKGNEETGCVWDLLVKPEEPTAIEQSTSIRFDRTTRILTLQVAEGVEISLSDETGTDLSRHCVKDGNQVTIATSKLESGTYLLTLRQGELTKELKFSVAQAE